MKRKILSFMLALVCILTCGFCLTACGNRTVWERPQRVKLVLPDKLHVEYVNETIGGDSTLPGYCTLVKEGKEYYVKTHHKYYHYNREEVYEKVDLNNAVVFDTPDYAQGYISARWDSYSNRWISAADDSETTPNAPSWHANDQNNRVFWTGYSFLDSGYNNINHIYENGVVDANGNKFTATQKANETLTIGANHVECVVWEYEEYFSADTWGKYKYWLDKETNIVLKQTSVYPSSQNQSLDADENIGLQATYFSKNENMQDYLASVDRNPKPDFSSYR